MNQVATAHLKHTSLMPLIYLSNEELIAERPDN